MAMQVDALRALLWARTEDAQKGVNQPASIAELFVKKEKKKEGLSFAEEKDFFEFWNKNGGG